ncbi:hypothetical protein Tco_0553240 [Tanacetum coccineum]
MNQQETQQVIARDEKWVPSADRVKISSTNLRLETTVPHKEETFQVIIDVIKNSTCFKAFTISLDVPEIFMQQPWCTIKKILDIYLRVEGEEFTELQNDDDTLTFLINLGYKGPLHKENVGYPELIWEDLAYQIDHRRGEIKTRLKFVRIGEDYHEYGLVIPDVMLNDAIKQSESYQMFIKCSTGQIPPKNSRGKGSQGKKTVDDSQETIDVSEGSEPVKKKTASRRVVKKKVTISANDNIIPDPDVSLELGKSISITEAEEAEAARQVHATHARIVTESVPKPAKKKIGSRSTKSVVIQDTLRAPKSKLSVSKPKLKGVQSLTLEEQEAANVCKLSKKSTVDSATSSEGNGTKPEVPDEEKVSTEEKIDSEEDDEKKDDTDDDKSIDLEMTDDEETDDEVLQGKEQVNDDEDEEMLNAEVEDSGKGDAEVSDAAKANAEKIKEAKDDSKKAEFPPTSSSLSISLGFGDQFLKLSSDTSLIGIVKDTTDVEINSLLDIKIQSEVPHIQSSSMLKVHVSVISEPSVLTPVQETPSTAPVTILPPPSVSTIPPAPLQQTTAPIPPPPITTDAPIITSAVPESDALSARHTVDLIQKYFVKPALESSKIQTAIINLEQESEKSASEILKIKKEQAEKQKMPKYTIKSTDKAALKEYDQKSTLYQTMHENKSFNRNLANHRLYHAFMEALIEDENVIDKGVADTGKKTKRRRTKELESSKKPFTTKETPKGKTLSKGSKTGMPASAKELVKEPIAEVVMDDAGKDVVRDDDQPQYISEPKTAKTLNPDLFKKPPRPPTPDPKSNKRQVVLGPAYDLLKGTCTSSIELKYNFQECFNALTDKLDWNNPEGDCYPFDWSKPLPLQGRPGHLTVAADYFFNNDLNTIKHTYDKDDTKGIKHWGERRKLWYISQMNKFSKHNVYSTQKILGVKSVSVKKLHGYGHLEEVMVKRADRQLCKFKEGDFVDLHLNKIEDMLLLAVQRKLFHLNERDIVDFIVALCMFTRSLIIKRRAADL